MRILLNCIHTTGSLILSIPANLSLSFSWCLSFSDLALHFFWCWQLNTLTHQTLTLNISVLGMLPHTPDIWCYILHQRVDDALVAGSFSDRSLLNQMSKLRQHSQQWALDQVIIQHSLKENEKMKRIRLIHVHKTLFSQLLFFKQMDTKIIVSPHSVKWSQNCCNAFKRPQILIWRSEGVGGQGRLSNWTT